MFRKFTKILIAFSIMILILSGCSSNESNFFNDLDITAQTTSAYTDYDLNNIPPYSDSPCVVKVILIPVLLGILLRTLAGEHVDKVSDVMPLISVVAIVMIIGGIVAVNAEKILNCGVLVLGVVSRCRYHRL